MWNFILFFVVQSPLTIFLGYVFYNTLDEPFLWASTMLYTYTLASISFIIPILSTDVKNSPTILLNDENTVSTCHLTLTH